jgi:hypothetical protein
VLLSYTAEEIDKPPCSAAMNGEIIYSDALSLQRDGLFKSSLRNYKAALKIMNKVSDTCNIRQLKAVKGAAECYLKLGKDVKSDSMFSTARTIEDEHLILAVEENY